MHSLEEKNNGWTLEAVLPGQRSVGIAYSLILDYPTDPSRLARSS